MASTGTVERHASAISILARVLFVGFATLGLAAVGCRRP
jgi:hypothetical protein